MLSLQLTRDRFSADSTQGLLDLWGIFECYTMEPRRFSEGMEKPYAIPAGTYPVIRRWSAHFDRVVLGLVNVPGFEDIEIHVGNTPRDTEGCILVGTDRYSSPDWLGRSEEAFQGLMQAVAEDSELSITIQENFQGA